MAAKGGEKATPKQPVRKKQTAKLGGVSVILLNLAWVWVSDYQSPEISEKTFLCGFLTVN